MIVVGLGLGKRAGCGALRLLKHPACSDRGFVPERGMRPNVVVVVAPQSQLLAGIGEAVEDLLVEAFIPEAAVEAFDQPVLLWLSRVDVVPSHAGIARPFEDRRAGELGAPPQENDPPDRFLIFVDR